MAVDVSLLAPSRMEGRPSASTSCHPYVPLGATAEAGCWKPAEATSACAFTGNRLDMRACHPASKTGDRVASKGVSMPHLPAFTEDKAFLAGLEQVRNRRLNAPVHIRWRFLRITRPAASR